MKYIFLIFFVSLLRSGQSQITAQDILNRSIDFCGGEGNIAKLKTAEMVYDVTTADSITPSLVVKIISSQKYMRSMLSDASLSSSLQYDGSTICAINGDTTTNYPDDKSGRIKLLTYILPQYGYKALSYTLKREEDQKFNYFDCYVLSASSAGGYTTLNYFDKTNYRLIMIVYPSGDKSLLIDYIFRDSVLVNTKIINVNDGVQSSWTLKNLRYNSPISKLWFTGNREASALLPLWIKKGVFRSSDGTVVTRTGSTQTEHPKNGQADDNLRLEWINNNTFRMADVLPSDKPSAKGIFVKIVSWDQEGYVCHYFARGASGTEEYTIEK